MLTGPFDDDGVFNVSTTDESSVGCVVDDVKPKPVISWFVDDVQLNVENVTDSSDEMSFVQTIAYVPGFYFWSLAYCLINRILKASQYV